MTSYSNLIPLVTSWKSQLYYPDTSTFTFNLNPPINTNGKKYGIAVDTIDTYYSFPNISEGTNNVFAYYYNGNRYYYYFPTGCYDITTINTYIQEALNTAYIAIKGVVPQLKAQLKIGPNYAVDFTVPNSINTILGFEPKLYQPGTYIGNSIVNINSTNSILVNCSLVNKSILNGNNSSIIYSFFPNVDPGNKVVKERPNLYFVEINTNVISSITVWLTDQDGNKIDFRGEVITIRFYLAELL